MSSARLLSLVAGLALSCTCAFASIASAQTSGITRPRVVTTTTGTAVSGSLASTSGGGATMSFGIVSQPAGGVVVLDDAVTGAFTYTPNIGTSGYDPFTFQVNDGSSVIQDTQMVFVVVSPQWPGQTIRASVAATGGQPNGSSRAPSISADGRYVAFESLASNLATGGSGASHVYLRDRLTGMTTVHSRATAGVTGTAGNSRTPAISADGRYLAFQSFSSNLVPGDSNNLADVFVRDLLTGAITRVNLSSAGLQATGGASSRPSISADGRYVAFGSAATNLVADDTNGRPDIFVHDRETGETTRVSVASDGAQAVGTSTAGSTFATISADGRFVAFASAATNLVPGDGNNAADVFVHDRVTGTTMLVSASVTGSSGNFGSGEPAISADGRVVLFRSDATNLLPAGVDTNLSPDAFVRDLVSGETTRVSVSSDGAQGNATINGTEINTSVSADGRYAVFMSDSAALVPGDTNGHEDVFVHDRLTRTTTRVSVTDGGDQTVPGPGHSNAWPSISADGRFIAFQSTAPNFAAGDSSQSDIFVVGGVSVTPLRRGFGPDGGADTIQVAFAYPGTAWTAASHVDWITITGPTGATADGTVTYTVAPNPGDPRTGTLTVATQTVTIEQAALRAPVAHDRSLAVNEDEPGSGTLTATDPNGDLLTFAIQGNGALGTVVIDNPATGAFTYTPQPNASGVDAFTFTASDGTATSNVATVTVTIAPVNDPPVAVNGTLNASIGTSATGVLAASDVDSASLTFSVVAGAAHGTVVLTNPATGGYSYTPHANAPGADSFTFQVSDGALASNVATVAITITGRNEAPVPQSGVVTTPEGLLVAGTLQATDANGGALSFSIASQPAGGSVVITDASTGAFTYLPNPATFGYDPFVFQVTDGTAVAQATQMVFVTAATPRWAGQTVRASVANSSAEGNNQSFTARPSPDGRLIVFASQATNFVAGDTNGVADIFLRDRVAGTTTRLTVSSAGVPVNGGANRPAISADERVVAYHSPATNLVDGDTNGTDDIFVYDRSAGTTTRVSVHSSGAQAIGFSTVASISADGRIVAFSSTASNLVSGDANGVEDVFVHDRSTGTTTRVSVSSAGVEGDGPSNQAALSADGRLVVFISGASTFDSGAGGLQAFVHDRITGETTRVSRSTTGVGANAAVSRPAISADGRFVAFESLASNLVPDDTNGQRDVFVHDRVAGATTRVSLTSANTQGNASSEQPTLSADGRFVAFQSLASNLVANDTNGQQDVFVRDRVTGITRRVSVAGTGAEATMGSSEPSISADGRFVIMYSQSPLVPGDTNNVLDVFVVGGVEVTPTLATVSSAGGTGSIDVSFVYPGTAWAAVSHDDWLILNGGSAGSGNGTVSYTVTANPGAARTGTLTVATQTVTIEQAAAGAPVAPTALDDEITTVEDQAASGTLGVENPDGRPLTFSVVTNGSLGVAAVDPVTGDFTYTPNNNTNGADRFTFKVNNGISDSNVATILVTITPVNDAPVAANGTLETVEDTAAQGSFPATDVDGPSLTFSIVTNGSKGTAVISNPSTGAFTYTPNADTNGADTVTFRASDGSIDSNIATMAITIQAVNDAPVAQNGTNSVFAGSSATATLVASDVDSAALTYAIVVNGTKGTAIVTNTATGAYTYTANAGASGTDTFTYKASDGVTDSNVATVTVTILANRPPVASNGTLTTTEDKSVTSTLSASDPEGSRLTFRIVSNGAKGTAAISNTTTGRFTYVPAPNANGSDSFAFVASDGTTDSNVAVVSVTITPVNDAPSAASASYVIGRNTILDGRLIGTDIDGGVISYFIVKGPRKGSLNVNLATGAFIYTPPPGFTGTESFTFKVSDGATSSASATVSIVVR